MREDVSNVCVGEDRSIEQPVPSSLLCSEHAVDESKKELQYGGELGEMILSINRVKASLRMILKTLSPSDEGASALDSSHTQNVEEPLYQSLQSLYRRSIVVGERLAGCRVATVDGTSAFLASRPIEEMRDEELSIFSINNDIARICDELASILYSYYGKVISNLTPCQE